MTPAEIKTLLQEKFPAAEIMITGEGCNLTIKITGEEFADKSRVKRQQMVYGVLKDYIQSGELHALTIIAGSTQEH